MFYLSQNWEAPVIYNYVFMIISLSLQFYNIFVLCKKSDSISLEMIIVYYCVNHIFTQSYLIISI